jgi:twitching motility protein PilT
MHCNSAIRNMVRENKVHQIDTVINGGSASDGMVGMDAAILALFKAGQITKESVLAFAETPELAERKLKGI